VTGTEPVTVLRHNFARKPFVCVMNEVARDSRVSFAARGVLIDMLSRPSNWQFSADRIAEGSPSEGRKTVLRCLRELRAASYVTNVLERDDQGHIGTVTVVSDEPVPGVG
jgi:hypothetical protein